MSDMIKHAEQPATSHQAKKTWRLLFLSSLGGALEMYDFAIFAVFAFTIGHSFFPSSHAWLSTMAAFMMFAIGYLVRPLGGLLFSHFGDRYGRKKVFLLTISLMAGTTFCMAILPSYASWGIIASCLFVILRLGQGLAIGGELPGAITFISEHFPKRTGFACGYLFALSLSGMVAADFLHTWLNLTTTASWTWRIAFLAGSLLAVISYFLRRTLIESPEFLNNKLIHRIPLLPLIQKHKRALLAGLLIVAFQATLISLMYLYMLSFLHSNHYSMKNSDWLASFGLAIFAAACLFWGWFADRVNRRFLLSLAIFTTLLISPWLYHAIETNQNVYLAYGCFAVVSAGFTGSFSAELASLFPVSIRFSGVALCFNIAFAFFAGLSPVVATYLMHQFNNLAILFYLLVAAGILGLIGLILARPHQSHITNQAQDTQH